MIFSLMTNKTEFMIQGDHATYHLCRWANWYEPDSTVSAWERKKVKYHTPDREDYLFPGANPEYQIVTKSASAKNLKMWLYKCKLRVHHVKEMVKVLIDERKARNSKKDGQNDEDSIDVWDQTIEKDSTTTFSLNPIKVEDNHLEISYYLNDVLLKNSLNDQQEVFAINGDGEVEITRHIRTNVNNLCALRPLANFLNRSRPPRLRINVAMEYIVYFLNEKLPIYGFTKVQPLNFRCYWTPEGHFLMAAVENTWGTKDVSIRNFLMAFNHLQNILRRVLKFFVVSDQSLN
jgi:hypothetical protein